MMGYYDDDTAARMHKMLGLIHPILPWVGRIGGTKETMQAAFSVGKLMGKAAKKERLK